MDENEKQETNENGQNKSPDLDYGDFDISAEHEKDDYGNNCIYAFTDCDGVLVTVSLNINGETRAREILYKVLDAYK